MAFNADERGTRAQFVHAPASFIKGPGPKFYTEISRPECVSSLVWRPCQMSNDTLNATPGWSTTPVWSGDRMCSLEETHELPFTVI